MIRILLANEFGLGRGHVAFLRLVAEALGGAFEFEAALYREEVFKELLPVCSAVFRGPGIGYDASRRVGPDAVTTATFGEFLCDLGFRDRDFLTRQIGWWRELYAARGYDLVVTSYAPCALLAARAAGLATAAIGTGYGLPPDGLTEFPAHLPEFDKRIYAEADAVAAINEAGAPLGLKPLRHLPEIYDCDAKLVTTIDFMDGYHGLRTAPLIPPAAPLSPEIGGAGDEIFGYLSNLDADPPFILEALTLIRHKVRIFAPFMKPDQARLLRSGGVTVEDRPVDIADIARRSRLFLNSGNMNTLIMGFAAGLPSITLPQHLEHQFHAARAEERGLARIMRRNGLTREAYAAGVEAAYADETLWRHAREQANGIRAFLGQNRGPMIQEQMRAPLLDVIRRKGLA